VKTKTYVYIEPGGLIIASRRDGTLGVGDSLTLVLPALLEDRIAVCDALLSEINEVRGAALLRLTVSRPSIERWTPTGEGPDKPDIEAIDAAIEAADFAD
jgi:hypothetical protein